MYAICIQEPNTQSVKFQKDCAFMTRLFRVTKPLWKNPWVTRYYRKFPIRTINKNSNSSKRGNEAVRSVAPQIWLNRYFRYNDTRRPALIGRIKWMRKYRYQCTAIKFIYTTVANELISSYLCTSDTSPQRQYHRTHKVAVREKMFPAKSTNFLMVRSLCKWILVKKCF